MCRQMMVASGQVPEVIVAFDLIPGTTGERDSDLRLVKMSKSRGNYIPVTADPADMYGKVMSIPDEVMWVWYRSLTEAPAQSIHELEQATHSGNIHPKDAKQLLARIVVATFNNYSEAAIKAAERDFNSKFGAGTVLVPESAVPFYANPDQSILNLLSSISGRSKAEVRRLCEQRGIWLLKDGWAQYANLDVSSLGAPGSDLRSAVIRIGKRHYFRATN
jgi:tyrosyl-tRNA synthetase